MAGQGISEARVSCFVAEGARGIPQRVAANHSPEGIHVNAVGPGPIFTPFHQRRIAATGEFVDQYNTPRLHKDHA